VLRGSRPVLEEITIVFPGGTRTVLWGPSGSGKSTLLFAIAGLLKPSSGTVRSGERVLFSKPLRIDVAPHERRIGFVFQDLALWPHLRALDQVRLAGSGAGVGGERAMELLESVGLSSLARRRPSELSGGEQQRLALARALAGRPEMLLLDEPLSSVDVATRRSLRSLIRELSTGIPGPTIYVTHDEADVKELAQGIVLLEHGRVRLPDPQSDPGELGL
jgi:ABC-type sulfate/molybdate transport systems ATPase subunit